MKKHLILSLLLATGTSAALAEQADWTGPYVGGHIGHGWAKNKDINNSSAYTVKPKGTIGGIQVGYNFQLQNNIVLGMEARFSLSNIKKDRLGGADSKSLYDPYATSIKIKHAISLNAKAGYAIDNFLPYITAGVTYAKREFGLSCNVGNTFAGDTLNSCKTNPWNSTASKNSIAGNVGVGVLYKVTPNLSVGAEYLYTDFGKKTVRLYDPKYPNKSDRKFKSHLGTLNANVSYHF